MELNEITEPLVLKSTKKNVRMNIIVHVKLFNQI
jgi:hypothetical protein